MNKALAVIGLFLFVILAMLVGGIDAGIAALVIILVCVPACVTGLYFLVKSMWERAK